MINNLFFSFAGVIIGFGFVIFVHELGHFAVAKWVGIKCTQFAIGFGQALLCWRKGMGFKVGSTEPAYNEKIKKYMQDNDIPEDAKLKERQEVALPYHHQYLDEAHEKLGLGETEYRLNWLPLGGYVKMLGQEDMDPKAQSEDPRSFNRKSIPGRMAVISAGVIMNLIFGMIFFIIAFSMGVNFPPARIGDVVPDSPAATTYATGHENEEDFLGLERGDLVTHVNDKPIDTFMMLQTNASLSARDEYLNLTVKREGVDKNLYYKVKAVSKEGVMEGIPTLGVGPSRSCMMSVVEPTGEFEKAGVKGGDVLTHIDGQPIEYYFQAGNKLVAHKGEFVQARFTRFEKAKDDQAPKVIATMEVPVKADPDLQVNLIGEGDEQKSQLHLLGMLPALRVTAVIPGSPAEKAGILEGDIVAQFGNTSWPDFLALNTTSEKNAGQKLAIEVLREGKLVKLDGITPRRKTRKKPSLGVGLEYTKTNYIAGFLKDSPFSQWQIPGGSQIVTVNGLSADNLEVVHKRLHQEALNHLNQNGLSLETLTDENASKLPPLKVTAEFQINLAEGKSETYTATLDGAEIKGLAELSWNDRGFEIYFGLLENEIKAASINEAAGMGIKHTHQFMLQTYLTLKRVFEGRIGVKNMRGVVGIVDVGTRIANEKGFTYLLFFLGLISVNLVVINFLPIPITDGGHIVLLLIEKIKGSPVSVKAQQAAMFAGLALIGSVFVITLFFDISRLLGDVF